MELGVGPFDAQERANAFSRHNVQSLEEVLPHWNDVERRRSMAVSAREQFEQQMENDRLEVVRQSQRAWQEDERSGDELVES
jgi:hypothetical protein